MTNLNDFPVPLLGFSAFSGTGKTTLLEKLIPLLVEKGLRIALVKHSHHDIELDSPTKDSYRLRKAGAHQVVLAGTHRSILFHENESVKDSLLCDQLALLKTDNLDLVLIEGYRDIAFPKIELHRQSLNKPLLYKDDSNIIAIVCDDKLAQKLIPQFSFSDINKLATFCINRTSKIKNK